MKKAFGYINFLIIIFVLSVVILGFNLILIRQKQIRALDLSRVQAEAYARTAVEFYKTKPAVPDNSIHGATLQDLINSEGLVVSLTSGGFKITSNKGTIYCLGYTGRSLQEAASIQTLKIYKEEIEPWQEN